MTQTLPKDAIAEGKTKIIFPSNEPGQVIIVSKDDITAGDGAKHNLIEGKAVLATTTTCNVFRLLKTCGIPVAFTQQTSDNAFSTHLCHMLPYEVVVRREAHGSFLKRMPGLPKRHLFPQLLVEFFLKTKDRKWRNHDLPCDDPYMVIVVGNGVALFDPKKPFHKDAEPFLILSFDEVPHSQDGNTLAQMDKLARRVFLILEKAWQLEGRTLVDFKVEFGFDNEGKLRLADVIDNDSWRVLEDGAYIDKQVYRDGGDLGEVTEKYRQVAEITGHFRLPVQRVIIWCGSVKDDTSPFIKLLEELTEGTCYPSPVQTLDFKIVTRSMHKEPVQSLSDLHQLIQETPETVVIAHIGRSNGAGPTLSAATTVPVITVPASAKDFPEDVWSSLRTPSNVPVSTVLEPANAVLAALQILAMNNPFLYMLLREKLEERLVNTIQI